MASFDLVIDLSGTLSAANLTLKYDGRAGVASWLFAIAANACRDRRRRERRGTIVPLEAVSEPSH